MAEANQKYFSSMAEFLKVKGEKSGITGPPEGAPGRTGQRDTWGLAPRGPGSGEGLGVLAGSGAPGQPLWRDGQ